MKRRIRIAAIIMTVCLMLSLGACGTTNTPDSTGGQTELSLWLPPYVSSDDDTALDLGFWQETLAPWAEENNVKLNISIIPWGSYEERYLTAFVGNEGPDVGYMYNEMLYEYISNGMLEPLDEYVTDEQRANSLYLDQGVIMGKQYTIPFSVGGARVMYYNMDLLAEAGVEKEPETWKEFTEAAVKVKEDCAEDVIPFAGDWATQSVGGLNHLYYPYMWQAGGELFNEDGTEVALLDNDGAVKAAQFLYDLRFKYEVIPEESMTFQENDVINLFSEGKIAMCCLSNAISSTFTDAGVNWSFVPGLKVDDNSEWKTWIGADSLVLNSKSENKELAYSLISYITSTPVMTVVHTDLFTEIPLNRDEPYLADEAFKDMSMESENLRVLPVAENAANVMQALKSNLQLMMMGDLTPEEAIQNTVDYAEGLS